MKRITLLVIVFNCLLFIGQYLFAQNIDYINRFRNHPPFYYNSSQWADSVLKTLTPDERIGQLFMVPAYSTSDHRYNKAQVEKLIKEYRVGGLIFMQGTPEKQIKLLNNYQAKSRVPLLVGMDAETGLGFRLKNAVKFPRNMTLGAIQDTDLIRRTGNEIALQCRRVGVHVNFVPDIDINNNPQNPVIGIRSFGENRYNVKENGYALMVGLQNRNILAVGKHFPGHGDTNIDSHYSLPYLKFSRKRLDSLELYPFKDLINRGIGGIMTAHLQVPVLDDKYPASISYKIVTELLKKELRFKGLIFTDALNMGGVVNKNIKGNIDLLALLAGNDVLLFSQDVPKGIAAIKKAIKQGNITQAEIDSRVRKILLAKYWVGLASFEPLTIKDLHLDLHNKNSDILQQELAKAAITLVKNKQDLLPLQRLDTTKIAVISIGEGNNIVKNPFQLQLEKYTDIKAFSISNNPSINEQNKLLNKLKSYNTIIVSKHTNLYKSKFNFGATKNSITFLKKIPYNKRLIFAFFGSPYGLGKYDLDKCSAILVGYEDTKRLQEAMGQAIFGGIKVDGKLPLSINYKYPAGWGIVTPKVRLGYAIPEEERINSDSLKNIANIIHKAIEEKSFPGCQLLISKGGNIVYSKSFGYHTYKCKRAVINTDLYDLASLTKVSATLPLLMRQIDKGSLKLSTTLGKMLPYFEETDKAHITLEDMLTHESGLPAWIPIYRSLIDSNSFNKKLISYRKDATYNIQIDKKVWLNKHFKFKRGIFGTSGKIQVGEKLFLKNSVRNILFDTIAKVKLPEREEKIYKYSDMGFILSGEYLKKQGLFSDSLKSFYRRLGAKTTTMQPFKHVYISRIVPTSNDPFMRKMIIRGYVHDPNSALLGGVAGHAGLFSNAEDLAKVWQMYLQNGNYGGENYIKKETVQKFIKQVHPKVSRRGIGFDKPDADTSKVTSFSPVVPLSTFGHTGFTGTMVWADPENELICIILTNRVYPNDWNNKMIKQNVRTRIEEAVYNTFIKKHNNTYSQKQNEKIVK